LLCCSLAIRFDARVDTFACFDTARFDPSSLLDNCFLVAWMLYPSMMLIASLLARSFDTSPLGYFSAYLPGCSLRSFCSPRSRSLRHTTASLLAWLLCLWSVRCSLLCFPFDNADSFDARSLGNFTAWPILLLALILLESILIHSSIIGFLVAWTPHPSMMPIILLLAR
jgi:hypothetical protein